MRISAQCGAKWIRKSKELTERRETFQAVKDGPKPWQRECSASISLDEQIFDLAHNAGWHRLLDLIEIFQWALASPRGQRAAELARDQIEDDPCNSWQEPYELVHMILPKLIAHSHAMLIEQAKGLNYSHESTDALDANLSALIEADRSDDYSLKP